MRAEVMEFYGLTRSPRAVGFYETTHHRQLLQDIKQAVYDGDLVALCGVVGAGKTVRKCFYRRWGRVVGMTSKIAGEPHTPRGRWAAVIISAPPAASRRPSEPAPSRASGPSPSCAAHASSGRSGCAPAPRPCVGRCWRPHASCTSCKPGRPDQRRPRPCGFLTSDAKLPSARAGANMHVSIPEVGRWLAQIVVGQMQGDTKGFFIWLLDRVAALPAYGGHYRALAGGTTIP